MKKTFHVKKKLTKPMTIGLLLLLCNLYLNAQTITKNTASQVAGTVCPVSQTEYSVSIPSNFGTCRILWTATNGEIITANNIQTIRVKWADTRGATATLSVKFSGCAANNPNEGVTSSKSELILSIKDQSFGTYTNTVDIDYCTPSNVTLQVPKMFVQGTGGINQPPLTEARYAWTLPPGWTTNGGLNTAENFITIFPTQCAKPGIVKVEGVIIDRCGSSELSAPATISLNGASPALTVGPQPGYTGGSICNQTPVTFYATTSVALGCITNYEWTYPVSWSFVSQSANSITLRPSGDEADSNPIKAKVNFSCGSSITSGNYIPPYAQPSITGPNLICSSGSFSLQNASGVTVTWSSSNPSVLSINPTSGVATRLNNFNGQITITATIGGGACGNVAFTQSVSVGTPFFQTGSSTLCNSRSSSVFFYNTNGLSYTWEVLDAFNNVIDGGVGTSFTVYGGQLGIGNFKVKAGTTSCTPYSNWKLTNIKVNNCGSFAGITLSAFPNPSVNTLTVQVEDKPEDLLTSVQGTAAAEPYQISIVDRFSNKVFSSKSFDIKTEISTEGLAPDIYYLIVQYKEAVLRKQIIIKRQ